MFVPKLLAHRCFALIVSALFATQGSASPETLTLGMPSVSITFVHSLPVGGSLGLTTASTVVDHVDLISSVARLDYGGISWSSLQGGLQDYASQEINVIRTNSSLTYIGGRHFWLQGELGTCSATVQPSQTLLLLT